MNQILFSRDIEKLLSKLDFSRLKGKVGIKLHFGEKGCNTYIDPLLVKKVYEKIISLGHEAKLIECNVLYRGERTRTSTHIKLAKAHGFDFADIDILDGKRGENFIEVQLDSGLVSSAKLGSGLKQYDSLVVFTHFKGHGFAAYGGAFKNIGMGLASRGGKLQMHATVHPYIDQETCTACGLCMQGCDFNAIQLNPKAQIDGSKCKGCAMCIEVCPYGAVKIPWTSQTSEELQKKIVDYAEAVLKILPKAIFINVATNITKDCDCMGIYQEPIMDDIGIFAGYDPVAVDKACLDKMGEAFMNMNPHDKLLQVNYAQEKGLGKQEYELINLD